MACLLCNIWEKLPFFMKPTTQTTPEETEGCLALGYWLGKQPVESRSNKKTPTSTSMTLCERHTALCHKYSRILDGKTEQPVQPKPIAFVFGIEPLHNENSNTSQPQLPSSIDISGYKNPPVPPKTTPFIYEGSTPKPAIDFVKMALEAAKAPPELGKTTLTCPTCNGEIESNLPHSCTPSGIF
jgi:hypothetical protein